ncbi:hypothetical protein GCM10010238_35300 [Streptomyces griseoviridis]|uniref:Uncharacterized protein n=1 Tax=Streptomyces griseoviridis TaxID=45398 RepID=A0A918GK94_STRGD|nr:hypothetical protein GCM10010238_35300 [Streptomyces niveoruber]
MRPSAGCTFSKVAPGDFSKVAPGDEVARGGAATAGHQDAVPVDEGEHGGALGHGAGGPYAVRQEAPGGISMPGRRPARNSVKDGVPARPSRRLAGRPPFARYRPPGSYLAPSPGKPPARSGPAAGGRGATRTRRSPMRCGVQSRA